MGVTKLTLGHIKQQQDNCVEAQDIHQKKITKSIKTPNLLTWIVLFSDEQISNGY